MRSRRLNGTLPTTRELLCAPELAVLAAIEAAIDVANVALVAAQPELGPSADGRDEASSPPAMAAAGVIDCGRALALAIARYRTALRDELHDLPF